MTTYQKNIISRLLKEKGKTKRELAAFLDIHENGINRLIGNNKISMERLEQIARFLDMNLKTLFNKIYPQPAVEHLELGEEAPIVKDNAYSDTEEIILLLSEIVKGQRVIKENHSCRRRHRRHPRHDYSQIERITVSYGFASLLHLGTESAKESCCLVQSQGRLLRPRTFAGQSFRQDGRDDFLRRVSIRNITFMVG